MAGDLTENFSAWEFRCPCGCGLAAMDRPFMEKLQLARTFYGKPMSISSGYRCLKRNKAIRGAKNSQHMHGLAADIRCTDLADRYEILRIAFMLSFNFIEVCDAHIHLDMRPLDHGEPRRCLWGKSQPSLGAVA
jgi:hypothetical protein